MQNNFILSLFPGIGLLDMAFEEHGYCIVRGPDVIWRGDIKKFHAPTDTFEGVIGGPPCQMFSRMAAITVEGKKSVIGNGVPLTMGRALARAVREATP